MNQLITILGPTATGKTSIATALASLVNGEIISADSRQVYEGMDIGSGKDLQDYSINGIDIPYHIIDIHKPGYEYNIYEFQGDFIKAFEIIKKNERIPIMCGGSGMYLDSILRVYKMNDANANPILRDELKGLSKQRLIARLKSLSDLHNTTDINSEERLIRAIEIAEAEKTNQETYEYLKKIRSINFGVLLPRQQIRESITLRLQQRLDEGMIEEVKGLLDKGFTAEQLMFYGLEYKYLTQYIIGDISYDEMFELLNTAIHQFAKRQMTWFRRMEKKGVHINWIDGNLSIDEKVALILQKLPR